MRIVHVTDCYLPRLGGIELQVHDLAERQAAEGHDVTVLTTTVGPDVDPPRSSAVTRLGGSGTDGDVIRYRRSRRGRRAAGDGGFDVVHAHASSFSPLAFLSAHKAARQGIPTVVTVHSLWASATPLFHMADRLTRWSHWPVAWSAVSGAAAGQLRDVLGGRADVHVLPNGVDPDEWWAPPVSFDADELRAVVVARLVPRKRLLPLVRILHDATPHLPDGVRLAVDIIGDGPEQIRLEENVRRRGLSSSVRFCGRLTRAEIRDRMAGAHLFISTAVLESFGIAALEARCTGVPVMARMGTGVQDFVRHGKEGWILDSDRAIAETLVALAHAPERVDRVRLHNCATRPDITWSSVLDRCDALYREAAVRQQVPVPDRLRARAIRQVLARP